MWRTYRYLRNAASTTDFPSRVFQLARELAWRAHGPASYNAITLSLRLAHAVTISALRQDGAYSRVRRALIDETFHLIRVQFRVRMGFRTESSCPTRQYGETCPDVVCYAFADGSLRGARAGVGVLLFDALGMPLAEVSAAVAANNSFEVELEAVCTTLATTSAIGMRQLQLHVDSPGIFAAFEGRVRDTAVRVRLNEHIRPFDALEVILIPRAWNHRADRLAARATGAASD